MSRHYEKSKDISMYYGNNLIKMAESQMNELIDLCKKIEFERKVHSMNSDIHFVKEGKREEIYKDFNLNNVSEEDLTEKIAGVMICLGAIGNRYMIDENEINKKLNKLMNL